MKNRFTLGFSPCPNDTFIFDALVNQKIDTGGISWEPVLEDVQTLNEWALAGKLDFSKISYGVYPLIKSQYTLLRSGGALGNGVGPLLISNSPGINNPGRDFSVAIPGENTTAHLLFSLAYPGIKRKVFKVFSEIEDAVLQGETDCGVIIHENRFTYQERGLVCLQDLGAYWETQTGFPIPLGGIIAHQKVPAEIREIAERQIRQSLVYAFENHRESLPDFVRNHAQEMSESVMRQHIGLYVNAYSLDIGDTGSRAVDKLLEIYRQLHPETHLSGKDPHPVKTVLD